jgi:hypothetical protein
LPALAAAALPALAAVASPALAAAASPALAAVVSPTPVAAASPTPTPYPALPPAAIQRPFSSEPSKFSPADEEVPPALPAAVVVLSPTALPSTTNLPAPTVLPDEHTGPYFRVAYLRPTQESALGRQWYGRLRQALLADADFTTQMAKAKLTDVVLRPCDGPEDMLQRMSQSEFDLVFCPALVYAQDRLAHPGSYRVLFQTRRGGVDLGDTRGAPPRRRGVIIAHRGSTLDVDDPAAQAEALKKMLTDPAQAQPLAVAGSYDAAGYFYVRKLLWEEFGQISPPEFLYLGTPQEVVKAVTSGLCEVGACEENAVREVLGAIPGVAPSEDLTAGANKFVRVLDRKTQWVPTDPVVVRGSYDPVEERSTVGRAAALALQNFCNGPDAKAGEAPALEHGNDTAYDHMIEDVKLTRGYPW